MEKRRQVRRVIVGVCGEEMKRKRKKRRCKKRRGKKIRREG